MPAPLISILIVSRNPGPRLREALESIWAQNDASHEIVIVDGASTDGTVSWLAANRHRLAAYCSEPDNGIYEAMNKAVALATGDWVLFLGADDLLATPDVLARAAPSLRTATADILVGEAHYTDGRRYLFAGARAAIRRNFVHHQAAFHRRTLFTDHGGFDPSLRIQADYDHNLRLLRAGALYAPLPLHIANCASGGASDSGRWVNYLEEITARHRHHPAWRCWPWDILAVIRYLRKKIVRSLAST
jgi:glycosyltransferase involved in cell wall biosynthesis